MSSNISHLVSGGKKSRWAVYVIKGKGLQHRPALNILITQQNMYAVKKKTTTPHTRCTDLNVIVSNGNRDTYSVAVCHRIEHHTLEVTAFAGLNQIDFNLFFRSGEIFNKEWNCSHERRKQSFHFVAIKRHTFN